MCCGGGEESGGSRKSSPGRGSSTCKCGGKTEHGGWVQGTWVGRQRAYPVSPQLTKYGCFREVMRAEWILGL